MEIHTGNQWQSLILPQLAKSLQVPEEQVVMRTYMLGGGFGRRLNGDYCIPAALASKAIGGAPVKLILTRSDDMELDSIRSPSIQTIKVALDNDRKKIVGMDYVAVAGWPTQVMAPAFLATGEDGKKYDPFAIAGADHWYETGPTRVRAISNDLANATFRPGWLRSVSAGWTPWALECFLDELAHSTKQDPLAFRLSMFTAQGRNAGQAPNSVGGASVRPPCSSVWPTRSVTPTSSSRPIPVSASPPASVRNAACRPGRPLRRRSMSTARRAS